LTIAELLLQILLDLAKISGALLIVWFLVSWGEGFKRP